MRFDTTPTTKAQRSLGATVLICVVVALIIASLNRIGSVFQVPEGVALVFPATAAAVVAGVLFRWWGVLAVFVGYHLLPWGLSTTTLRITFFAFAASLEAAIPAAVRFRMEGTTTHRTLRLLLFGAIFNTLASSLVGVPMVVHLSTHPMTAQETAFAFSSWFLGDVLTVCILGLPILVLGRPKLFMRDVQVELFRQWMRRRSLHALSVFLVVLIAIAIQWAGRRWGVNVHWLATLFIAPVLLGAATGGVGGAIVSNGIVGIVYVAEVLLLAGAGSLEGLFNAVLSSYINLFLFTAVAVVSGLYAGRSRALLAEVREHERLLQRSFEHVVTALAAAIEAKDPTTQGHVQRVGQITMEIGRKLGIERQRLDLLRYAAILHDVGKIGVPENVLNKIGPLDDAERRLVMRHVSVGVDILKNVDMLTPAIPFIKYHQERWDGQKQAAYPGYFGLRGEEIPLEARIIAVVDAFDAMTSDRPYREALSQDAAILELRREAGRQFDPDVVEMLIGVITADGAESGTG